MPPSRPGDFMNPISLVFGAISNLTGGLITDLQTVMVGVIGCLAILLAIRYALTTIGLLHTEEHCSEEDLWVLFDRKENATGFEKDMLTRKYNRAWAKTKFKSDCK